MNPERMLGGFLSFSYCRTNIFFSKMNVSSCSQAPDHDHGEGKYYSL